jgi:CTP-dependent riboflavin kinase
MKLYLKLYFSSEGASVNDIIQIAEKMGFTPYVGDYDFVVDFETPEEYCEIAEKVHKMLRGTKTMYKVTTRKI